MKYTHRCQDSFVERKALEYSHNLVRNLEDKIDLSCWVGGTEHNIANAFKDAEALRRIDNVTPGDMAVVRQNLFWLRPVTL